MEIIEQIRITPPQAAAVRNKPTEIKKSVNTVVKVKRKDAAIARGTNTFNAFFLINNDDCIVIFCFNSHSDLKEWHMRTCIGM